VARPFLLLPTFDGQTRGVAAVNPEAITLIKPAVSPGMSNLYLGGDQNNNYLGVELELAVLIEQLKKAGLEFTDLSGGRGLKVERTQNDDGH
jgi:hypothetical protein